MNSPAAQGVDMASGKEPGSVRSLHISPSKVVHTEL